jgi:hypothetical protein
MEQHLLDILLSRLQEKGLLKTHRRQRTDSTHVLAAIRTLNRLETLGEGMRCALDSLTVAAPEWLASYPIKNSTTGVDLLPTSAANSTPVTATGSADT